MGIVHKLTAQVANCIAAGEVVENPASVVKELCENAIDAGADEITVSIRDGGLTEISVSDNGCGMSPEDAETAFLRHATSKLSCEADLEGIVTLGFRGEALAAISAVSDVTLETRQARDDCGTLLELEYGHIVRRDEAVIMPGSTFTVRGLFRNTPARMKFLRTNMGEASAVTSVTGKLALSHPEIRFTMIKDGRVSFSTSGSGDPMQTITDICGKDFAAGLVPLPEPEPDLTRPRIWGYVTIPNAARASRVMQYTFLNGRSIQNTTVTSALEEAYHSFQPTGKFPGSVLHIAIDPALVDINVHPSKMTVKFTRENDIFNLVYHAVCDALRQHTDRPTFTLNTVFRQGKAPDERQSVPTFGYVPPPKPVQTVIPAVSAQILGVAPPPPTGQFYPRPADSTGSPATEKPQPRPNELSVNAPTPVPADWESLGGTKPHTVLKEVCSASPQPPEKAASAAVGREAAEVGRTAPENPIPAATPVPEPTLPNVPPLEELPDFRIAGMLFSTYIIVESGDKVLFIDFHAVHERIRFDKLLDEYRRGGIAPQLLLSSVILPVSPEEYTAVCDHQEELLSFGVEVESFGEREIAVRALPPDVRAENAAALLRELCRDLRRPRSTSSFAETLLHRVACHSAVRGGDTLSDAECRALAARVLTDPDLRCCPHGRPVALIMKKRDFIRNFER